jgi:hypothetical protein
VQLELRAQPALKVQLGLKVLQDKPVPQEPKDKQEQQDLLVHKDKPVLQEHKDKLV